MSEHFSLRCDTCGAELGEHGRLGAWDDLPDLVLELIEHAPRLVALWVETGRVYEISAWWGPVPLHFLEAHQGHALRPISEYEPR